MAEFNTKTKKAKKPKKLTIRDPLRDDVSDIVKDVAGLKIDDDTKPPPTEAASIDSTAADLSALTVPKLKEQLRAKGLLVGGRKQELIDRLAHALALVDTKPPASNGRSSYWAANNGEVVLFYLTDDDDDDVETKIEEKLTYMPDEWGTLNTFTDLRAPPPPIESASIESASPPPIYLKFKINNRKKEELHFLCLQDEEELEEYGDGSAWDWPEKHLQLDYTDVDLEPDIEEITKEEYEKNATTAYSYCFIRDLTPEERATYNDDGA